MWVVVRILLVSEQVHHARVAPRTLGLDTETVGTLRRLTYLAQLARP